MVLRSGLAVMAHKRVRVTIERSARSPACPDVEGRLDPARLAIVAPKKWMECQIKGFKIERFDQGFPRLDSFIVWVQGQEF